MTSVCVCVCVFPYNTLCKFGFGRTVLYVSVYRIIIYVNTYHVSAHGTDGRISANCTLLLLLSYIYQ